MAKKKKEEELLKQGGELETVETAEAIESAPVEPPGEAAAPEEPPLPESGEAPPPDGAPEALPEMDGQAPDCEILSAEPEPIRPGDADTYILDAETGPTDGPSETDIPDPGQLLAAPETAAEDFLAPEETADAVSDDALDFPAPGEPEPPEEPSPARKGRRFEPGEDRRAFYHLDFHELDRGLSPEEQQEWNAIYASYRGRSVLTGTVVGIDLHAVRVRDRETGELRRQEMYCAIVIPFRVRILIPETEMWGRGEERPGFVLRNIVGAKLDVVIIHVDREAGFAIGSRRMALSSRRYYFAGRPNLSKPGTRVKCGVLAVGPRRCLVACHGFDVNLTQREMRYTAIPDLRDVYHPGDELECIVKEYDAERGWLMVSVKETQPNPFEGAELRHPVGSRRQAVIAGKYAGGVFCNLPDGAVCMCNYSYHYEDGEFAVGDKVILVPQRYENAKKQIYGKIVAKW